MESKVEMSAKSVRRRKQIAVVKSSDAYVLYAARVPKEQRGDEGYPFTPPVSPKSNATISKRKWERMQLEWRGCIEQYYEKATLPSAETTTTTTEYDQATSELINSYFKHDFNMPSLQSPKGESRLNLYKNLNYHSNQATSSCST